MSVSLFPIEEYLVPVKSESLDDSFNIVEQKLMYGMPQKIELDAEIHVFVIIPNGLANTWRDSEATLVLNKSSDEKLLHIPATSAYQSNADRIPARLLLRRDNQVLSSVPLVSDLNVKINCSSTANAKLIELKILDWDLRAGVLRDNGDYGSTIRFAWRTIEKGVEQYSIPPVNPYVISRLKPIYKMHSLLGLKFVKVMPRFSVKQNMIKVIQ